LRRRQADVEGGRLALTGVLDVADLGMALGVLVNNGRCLRIRADHQQLSLRRQLGQKGIDGWANGGRFSKSSDENCQRQIFTFTSKKKEIRVNSMSFYRSEVDSTR